MVWGNNNNQGPWGRPPVGGSGGPRPPKKPEGSPPPDLDELLRKGQEKFRRMLGNNGGGGQGSTRRTVLLVTVGAAVMWLATGIYLVKADEEGIVLRFGQYHRTTPAGVGYHLPWPVEAVKTPKVTAVNRTEIGFNSGGYGRRAAAAQNSLPEESLMLTGDENIVDIHFEVQWKIAKAEDFLFNIRGPEETVKAVSESAMREVIGKTKIASVLAEGKLEVEQTTRKLIQDVLNNYHAGVEVISVNLLQVNPPSQVVEAFQDVQTAQADQITTQNQATSYRNDIIPRARGEAEKMVLDAEAYAQETVSRSTGEAARFTSVYNEYKQARDVTKKRMYLETMEEILRNMQKMIIGKQSGAVPYLPLNDLAPKAPAKEPRQ